MKVLLVEDEAKIRSFIEKGLKAAGFSFDSTDNGDQALELASYTPYDAIILDIMIPGKDGLSVLKELRTRKINVPVILATARGALDDKLEGLNLGADDYLPKPFNPRELLARIKAILRRAQPPADSEEVLELGEIRLDTRTHKAAVGDNELRLTGTEFEILKCLLETPGKVVNKERLSERALGRRLLPYDRSVDTHISNLRGKLEKAGNRNETIQNQRGVGYLLIPGS